MSWEALDFGVFVSEYFVTDRIRFLLEMPLPLNGGRYWGRPTQGGEAWPDRRWRPWERW
jgi:hypothetical protein